MRKSLTKILLLLVALNLLLACRNNIAQQRKFIAPIPFEKQKWLGAENDGTSDAETRWKYRPGMARYLINKEILIGKSRAEVIEMLGKYSSDDFSDSNQVSYELESIMGFADPLAIESLKLSFNQENEVEKVEIDFYKTRHWKE